MGAARARYENKVVVVTGAANGLGLAYADAFAAEGARVVLADIDGAGAAGRAAAIVERGGHALGVEVDVADEVSVLAMADAATQAFGGVDVLVNNAGLHLGRYNECIGLPVEEWRRILDVNVIGAVLCTRACRPSMAARGGGVVLNQSSVAAWSAASGAYGASKLALQSVTMSLAVELAVDRVRVVAVAPGAFLSQAIVERLEPAHRDIVLAGQLTKQLGVPEDLVPTVLFLCSDEAAFVNASVFTVDAGFTKRL